VTKIVSKNFEQKHSYSTTHSFSIIIRKITTENLKKKMDTAETKIFVALIGN
jgi:hypothetical protein